MVEKQGWFRDKITELNSDVIGFQEVFSPNALEALVNELGYAYFCTVDEPKSEDGYVFNSPIVAFASRYPILRAQPVIAEKNNLSDLAFSLNLIVFPFMPVSNYLTWV